MTEKKYEYSESIDKAIYEFKKLIFDAGDVDAAVVAELDDLLGQVYEKGRDSGQQDVIENPWDYLDASDLVVERDR